MPLPNQAQAPDQDDDDEQDNQPESPQEGQEADDDSAPPAGLVATQQKPKRGVKDKKKPGHKGASKSAVHPDSVLAHIAPKVPPQFQQGFIGAIKSVMQFVTSPSTHKYFLQALAGPGPIAQKLSEGVQHLLTIIAREAKGKFPPQMLIPVGIYSISWLGDYANRAGLAKVQDSDIALADQMFVHDVMMQVKNRMQAQSPIGRAQQQGAPPGQPGAPQAPPQPGPALPKMTAAPSQAPGANPNLGPGAAPGPQAAPPPRMG